MQQSVELSLKELTNGGDIQMLAGLAEQAVATAAQREAELEAEPVPPSFHTLGSMR